MTTNAYDELFALRLDSGRGYDKRSVETFRARALDLVDDLLRRVTELEDRLAKASEPADDLVIDAARSEWLRDPADRSVPPLVSDDAPVAGLETDDGPDPEPRLPLRVVAMGELFASPIAAEPVGPWAGWLD